MPLPGEREAAIQKQVDDFLAKSPPRPNALPMPSIYTGWLHDGQPLAHFDAYSALRSDGFSREAARDAVNVGCTRIASHRVGAQGRFLSGDLPGITRFYALEVAWRHLESLVAGGKKARLVLLQSFYPPRPYLPSDDPIPAESLAPMIGRYDFVVLHWDPSQKQYYWESIHDARGRLWRGAFPFESSYQGGMSYNVFLVVEITPEREANAQGLPCVPWSE